MIGIKLLFFLAGSGTVAGITASKIYNKTETQSFTSNTKQAKRLAKAELKLTENLLKLEKDAKENSQTRHKKNVETKTTDFTNAQQELQTSYDNLNDAKKELNNKSQQLSDAYSDLTTKNNEFKDALTKKIKHDLDENERTLKETFYNAQKSSYEKEKDSIKLKIETITSFSISQDICGDTYSFAINSSTTKTTNETQIENEITQELTTVCGGLKTVKTELSKVSTALVDSSDYQNKKTARETAISKINTLTSEYNLQLNKISSAEFATITKLNSLKLKEQFLQEAKSNLGIVENELDEINEKLNNLPTI